MQIQWIIQNVHRWWIRWVIILWFSSGFRRLGEPNLRNEGTPARIMGFLCQPQVKSKNFDYQLPYSSILSNCPIPPSNSVYTNHHVTPSISSSNKICQSLRSLEMYKSSGSGRTSTVILRTCHWVGPSFQLFILSSPFFNFSNHMETKISRNRTNVVRFLASVTTKTFKTIVSGQL